MALHFVKRSSSNNTMRNSCNGCLGKVATFPRILFGLLACIVFIRFLRFVGNQRHETLGADLLHARPDPFRVLCTIRAARHFITSGSYNIRCRDFKLFAESVFPNVEIDTVPISQASGVYNATMIVKSIVPWWWYYRKRHILGRLFVDVVDDYKLVGNRIPPYYEVITQNEAQRRLYPQHKTHVVTHWYNSYPADDAAERKRLLPFISDVDTLKMATIWDPLPSQAGCLPIKKVENVVYDCIEEKYFINLWYHKYLTSLTLKEVDAIMSNPQLGSGYLYHELFRKYHVLVILAKDGPKLTYGNVQRIVSQMCSGVPVLIENRGEAFREFIDKYKYPCVFEPDARNEGFRNAVARLKSDSALRRQCQEMALQIVEDFSPKTIVHEFMRVFGYDRSEQP